MSAGTLSTNYAGYGYYSEYHGPYISNIVSHRHSHSRNIYVVRSCDQLFSADHLLCFPVGFSICIIGDFYWVASSLHSPGDTIIF